MSYKIIQPPFTLKFREMSKQELKSYYIWFFEVMPERINELASAVQSSQGFEAWLPDNTPTSLELLGKWFATQVEIRSRNYEEIESIRASLSFPINIPDKQLTNKTFSLAMDIGMYLGGVFLSQYPSLKWGQLFGNKKLAEYGCPVLLGFGHVPMDPVWIMVMLAYGIADGKKTGNRLKEIYEYWSQSISKYADEPHNKQTNKG
jgi:hypothetical protein